MILEVAILDVKPGREAAFERDLVDASVHIASIADYTQAIEFQSKANAPSDCGAVEKQYINCGI